MAGNSKAILAVAAVALAGAGVYVLLKGKKDKTKEQTTEFRNLLAQYMELPQTIGQSFPIVMSFGYIGPGGNFDVGIGVAPATPFITRARVEEWAYNRVTLPSSENWKEARVVVRVTSLSTGRKDAMKFIQVAGGDRDPGGEGFIVADWDKNVFEITSTTPINPPAPIKTEIRNIQAGYQKV